MPNLDYEISFSGIVAGVDEAGRGPWAGPVYAGAAIIYEDKISKSLFKELNDSKKLSHKKRETLFEIIQQENGHGLHYGIGIATAQEIDELNILQATFTAMRRAIEALPQTPDMALIDGNRCPKQFPCPTQYIIKGDSLSSSIALASIVAKVSRDRHMNELAQDFPYYGWDKNAGYGTKIHIEALEKYGICEHHRKSYAPIKKFVA